MKIIKKLLNTALFFIKELIDYCKLFDEKNRTLRKLVFYSEKDIYFQYFKGYIDYILLHSNLNICYITSDPNDYVFKISNNRIKTFYIKNSLSAVIARLDSKAIIMTMPDLNNHYIKKSNSSINYMYLFHAIGSTHLQYNKGAFDHYDTIFCIGPTDYKEIRKTEDLYHLKHKNLIQSGYYRLEQIYLTNKKKIENKRDHKDITLLIAPSWHVNNILEFCINELIEQLKNSKFKTIIRPHPEYIKRKIKNVEKIVKAVKNNSNISVEMDLFSENSIYEADVIITDWSSISFEYAFGTERPVLFINTPPRINNPKYKELCIEPLEFVLRNKIGMVIELKDIQNLQKIIFELVSKKSDFQTEIIQNRTSLISNWLHSSEVVGDYIIKVCNE
jgi:YidC/Oxa1 family membrane protein insertase